MTDRTGLSQEEVHALTSAWNDAYPGKGEVIFKTLRPFYAPSFCLRPKTPLPDLAQRAQRAVFWKKIPGIDQSVLDIKLKEFAGFTDEFADEIEDRLGSEFLADLLQTILHSFTLALPESATWLTDIGVRAQQIYRDPLWRIFVANLVVIVAFLILGDSTKDFLPYLELWEHGNLPLGFRPDGLLIILCT